MRDRGTVSANIRPRWWSLGWGLIIGLLFLTVTVLTLSIWVTDRAAAETNPVVDLAFLALGLLIASGLATQAASPPSTLGLALAVLASGVLATAGVFGRRIEPAVGGLLFVAVTVVGWWLRPVGIRPLRLRRPSWGLAALVAVAAIGACGYAARMMVEARAAGSSCFLGQCARGDRYAEAAATAVVIVLTAALGSCLTARSGLALWWPAATAAALGIMSVLLPDIDGSWGQPGGLAAVAWAFLYFALGERLIPDRDGAGHP